MWWSRDHELVHQIGTGPVIPWTLVIPCRVIFLFCLALLLIVCVCEINKYNRRRVEWLRANELSRLNSVLGWHTGLHHYGNLLVPSSSASSSKEASRVRLFCTWFFQFLGTLRMGKDEGHSALFGPHPPRVVPPLRILRDLLTVMSVVRNDGLRAHLQMKRWISLRLLGSGTSPFSSKFIQNKIFLYFTNLNGSIVECW